MAAGRQSFELEPPVRFLEIGVVVGPYGVDGEVRVAVTSDFPERFAALESVRVGERLRPYEVTSARLHRAEAILKLRGVDDASAAAALRGEVLRVSLADAVPPPEEHYYWHQIIGLQVLTPEGERLGQVVDILRTGANDVYVVRGPRGEVLVPAIEDVVQSVDLSAGRMIVTPLPGMLEE